MDYGFGIKIMKFRNNKIEFVESNEEDEEGYMDGEDES
jgi:hypothetical protein